MKKLLLVMMVIILAGPFGVLAQEEKTTAQQLQTLRQELEELRERLLSLERDFALEQETAAKTLVGGYIQTTFTDFEDKNPDFNLRRMILFVGAEISKHFRFASEIEFEFGGTPFKGEEFGEIEPGEVKLEQAYLDWSIHPAFNVRGGIILPPIGKFNLLHDPPLRDLSTRPMVDLTVIPTTWFEAGVGLFGAFAVSPLLEVNYEVYVINGLDDNIRDGTGFFLARGSLGVPDDNNDSKAVVFRIGLLPDNIGIPYGDSTLFLPLNGLDVGLSYYYGKYDDDDDRSLTIFGLDVTYKRGPLELLFEGAIADLDKGLSNARDAQGNRLPVPERMEGFFVQVNWHFWPGFLDETFLARDNPTFTLMVRYGEVDTDDDRTTAIGDRKRLTIGFNFRPLEETVIKLEYLFDLDDRDNPAAFPDQGFVFEFSSYF